tara:strand:+ start:649 stop:1116 length:468 start_codon:yes stop_codon:yes gene_type:complete
MSVEILTIDQVQVVKKPWGWEKWIANGNPKFRYALKEIFIRAPYRSSLQLHQEKQESNFILGGRGVLHYSQEPVDVERYLAGGYSEDELQAMAENLVTQDLLPGTVFHIRPHFLHRVESVEDLRMVEASTIELDDVLRIADDNNRGHNKIESEHQ